MRFRPGRSAAIVNIGAALVAELVGAGHSVTTLVRTEAAAAKATGLGARAEVGDLFDTGWLTGQFAADAVAHLAATGDAGVLSRDDQGRVRLVGAGDQHWTTVHVDDVAALDRTVLERGEGLGYLLGVAGEKPTVRELGEARAGAAGVVAESADASRKRLGALFADALLLDQRVGGAGRRRWAGRRRGRRCSTTCGAAATAPEPRCPRCGRHRSRSAPAPAAGSPSSTRC